MEQSYEFYCLHNKRMIALTGASNIRTGVNTSSSAYMPCLLRNQGLV